MTVEIQVEKEDGYEGQGLGDLMTEEVTGAENEGKPVEKEKHTPPVGSPRWEEIYKRSKDAERAEAQIAEMQKQIDALKEGSSVAEAVAEHNKKLAAAIERLASSNESKQPDEGATELAQIEERIKALSADRVAAREALDYERQDKLEQQLDDLKEKRIELKSKAEISKQQTQPQIKDPVLRQFVEDNPWFISDPKMNKYAVALERKYTNDPDHEMFFMTREEQLKEIAKMTKEKFGMGEKEKEEGGTKAPRVKVPSVESGKFQASSNNSGVKTIKLTKEQLAAASFLRISPEEYAKQLSVLEG